MSKRWMIVAGALLLLCVAPPAVMAAAESMLTLTLGSQAPRGAFSDVAEPGSMVGLSAGYRVTRWLAMGADYNYFGSSGTHNGAVITIDDHGTGKPSIITLVEHWAVTNLGLHARAFMFERGRFSPYLRVGAGTYSIRYSQDVSAASASTTLAGVEQVSKAGINGGAGLRYRLFGGTTIGFEAVYHEILAKNVRVNLLTTGVTVGFGPTGN
jgi:hypothetical protein